MIKEFSIVCTEKIDITQTLKYLIDAYGCHIPGYYITEYKGYSDIPDCRALVFTSDTTTQYNFGLVPSNDVVMTEVADQWLKSLDWLKKWKSCEIFSGDETNLGSVHGNQCIGLRILEWEDIK